MTLIRISAILSLLAFAILSYGQSEEHSHDVYDIDLKKDVIIAGTGITLTIIGDILLNKLEEPNLIEIGNLNANTLWPIDRPATQNFSKGAEKASDIILFTAAALPFTLYAIENTKGEELEMLVMITETFLITNGTTNIVKALAKRYRPFNYNPQVSNEMKLGSTSRQSFFSGHASNTAAFCFLTARSLNDFHPHWTKGRKVLSWGLAGVIPLAISYGRYQAGKHFATDVITGYIFGASVGLIIPKLHKSNNTQLLVAPGQISFNLTF